MKLQTKVLEKWLVDNRLYQKDLAAMIGISPRMIGQYLDGKACPTRLNRLRLLKATGLPAEQLFIFLSEVLPDTGEAGIGQPMGA